MADPGYNWSGFYVGVNAGYGVGSAPTSLTVNDAEANYFSPDLNPLPGTLHPRGFTGGGQLGFNYQFGSLVTGLEADLAYARLRQTDSATG